MGLFNFLDVPRSFGSPKQYIDPKTSNPIVYDKNKLISLIKENNDGNHDVFVSHQRFKSFIDRKPFEIEISKLFFDFDGKQNPPIDAFKDLKKVINFYDKHNIPYLVVYSGMKGFHLYIPLNSTNHINATYLKKMYRSIMIHLKKELNLSTIDASVATPIKLCRVFYTKHPKSKRYCCPIKRPLIDQGLQEIIKYSVNPDHWVSDILKDKQYLTIEEYINYFNIDIKDETQGIVFTTMSEKYNNPNNEYLIQLLHYPCLINSILDIDNAIHFARFMCALHLKRIGCDPLWVFNFFKQRQYIDVEFENECKYQINTIFGNNYTFPSCKRIKENGLCVGSTCKYYKGD
jgi:hypothetical protein